MGKETEAVDHGTSGEPPGLSCLHPVLSQKHGARQWQRMESDVAAHPHPEGLLPDEKLPLRDARRRQGTKREWSRQLLASGAQAWHKVFPELGHHTFHSAHA